jgi:hypothetical protein
MGHNNAAFGQDQLDVTQAETEHVIQPDGMADDLGRKPMPRKPGGLVRHAVSLVRLPLKRHWQLTWQCHQTAYPMIAAGQTRLP